MRIPRPSILLVTLAVCLFAGRLLTEPFCLSRPTPAAAAEPTMVLRGQSLKSFAFGNDAAARALAWARLAVDASYEPMAKKGLSWEYGQLDAVTALDRNFNVAYPFGSAFLSTFRRDEEGAFRILEKWVRYAPTNWRSHAWLGYHLYFEMNRPQEAAPHLLRASLMQGAPAWLAAMGARVLSESERLPQQLRRLVELYPSIPEGVGRVRLSERIRAVRLRYETERLERALAAYRQKHRQFPAALADAAPFLEAPSRAVASLDEVATNDPLVQRQLAMLFAERFVFRYDRSAGTVFAEVDPALRRLGTHPSMNTAPERGATAPEE